MSDQPQTTGDSLAGTERRPAVCPTCGKEGGIIGPHTTSFDLGCGHTWQRYDKDSPYQHLDVRGLLDEFVGVWSEDGDDSLPEAHQIAAVLARILVGGDDD